MSMPFVNPHFPPCVSTSPVRLQGVPSVSPVPSCPCVPCACYILTYPQHFPTAQCSLISPLCVGLQRLSHVPDGLLCPWTCPQHVACTPRAPISNICPMSSLSPVFPLVPPCPSMSPCPHIPVFSMSSLSLHIPNVFLSSVFLSPTWLHVPQIPCPPYPCVL